MDYSNVSVIRIFDPGDDKSSRKKLSENSIKDVENIRFICCLCFCSGKIDNRDLT